MAGRRGRDISISLSTDLDRFETRTAERDLEDLGDTAVDAGRGLRDLGDDAERAGRSLDDVGDGAHRAADETDDAMGEIRETSRGAANEMAAGFDGSFDSVIGGLQGMVAEFGMSLGPAAMGGLMAGAAVIGAGYARVTEVAEQTKERVDGLRERIRELNAAGGQIKTPDLRDWIDEKPADEMQRMADNAAELGIGTDELARALYGESEARLEVTKSVREQEKARDAELDGLGRATRGFERWAQDWLGVEEDVKLGSWTVIEATDDLSTSTRNLADEVATATEADKARSAALGGLTDQQISLNEALAETSASIIDASDDVEQAMAANADGILSQAQAMADASEIQTDTWADHLADVQAATNEVRAQLEADNAALVEFQRNTETALKSGGENLVEWANAQADPIGAMKLAAQMTPADATYIGSTYASNMQLAERDIIAGTTDALAGTETVARDAGTRDARAYATAYKAEAAKQSPTIKSAYSAGGYTSGSWTATPSKAVP